MRLKLFASTYHMRQIWISKIQYVVYRRQVKSFADQLLLFLLEDFGCIDRAADPHEHRMGVSIIYQADRLAVNNAKDRANPERCRQTALAIERPWGPHLVTHFPLDHSAFDIRRQVIASEKLIQSAPHS